MNYSSHTLIAAVALVSVGACRAPSITVTRTQSELQETVAKHFPISVDRRIASLTLRDPVVILRDGDDQLGLDVTADVKLPMIPPFTGRIAALGKPFYDPAKRSFYLREPIIDRHEVPGMDESRRAGIRTAIAALAAPALSTIPVYRLEGRNLTEVTAAYLLTDVRVKDGRLRLTLSPGAATK